MSDIQTEKCFQKQEAIKNTPRAIIAKAKTQKKKSGFKKRYYKDIGLGFKTPRTAIEGNYVDKKCPFTSDVAIRGAIFRGVVQSTKMTRTVIVRRDYLHFVKKFERYEKRHHNIAAHCSPAFATIKEGDVVSIGQCRPLSKTVTFNVIEVEATDSALQKSRFRMF